MEPAAAPPALPKVYETYDFVSPSRFTGKLKGKVTLITGASSGVGREACLAFAATGASVAAVARRQNLLDELVQEIKAKHAVPCIPIAIDVSEAGAAKTILQRTESALGEVDILLNCAGITRMNLFHAEPDLSIWWRVLEVNLRSSIALTHAVLPSMIRRKTGILMSVTSEIGAHDYPFVSAYGVSKSALTKFHQVLALEVAKHGILSFSIHPGSVETGIHTAEDAVDEKVLAEPEVQELLQSYLGMEKQRPRLMGDVCVALCCEPRCRALGGRYVDCEVDLEKVVEEVEKEGGGRVGREGLFKLKVDGL